MCNNKSSGETGKLERLWKFLYLSFTKGGEVLGVWEEGRGISFQTG